MTPEHFLTHSLQTSSHGPKITRILSAALQAVEPGAAVRRYLRRQGETLFVDERPYRNFGRVYLIGAGKASVPMAQAAADILGEKLAKGIVITKNGMGSAPYLSRRVRVYEAGHPIPDQDGVDATFQVLDLLTNAGRRDLILCLISGGGSALLTFPAVKIEDLRTLTDQLLACGATIQEINTLRKHLDGVKGGRLADDARYNPFISLILSDVVGNPLDIIASGPTVPDPTTFADAVAILKKYNLWDAIPSAVRHHLEMGLLGGGVESPKPGDPLFDNVQNVLVGSNELAAEAARAQAEQEGFQAKVVTTEMAGEARERGNWILDIGYLKTRPSCLIFGGETTVTLGSSMAEVGKGGRNQEMALAVVRKMAEIPDALFVTLATDGGDGPTDAAGAVVTTGTLARAEAAGLNPDDFLARHDAYHFFDPLGDLLRPGPTQTNVNDLAFLFLF
ncbi:MAG: glycerate kinase [Anaerolineales bacterium]